MNIVRLQIRNFIGLKEVDIKTNKVNIVKGKNRQGKTSLIKAIEAAFQAGDQSAKIRNGESSAEILVELDELYVQRSISRSGKNSLNVVDKTGEIIKRPQEHLDSIVGGFSFDPAEFFTLKNAQQREYILQSFPIKVSKADVTKWCNGFPDAFSEILLAGHGIEVVQKLRKHFYERRTVVNREVDAKLKAGQEMAKNVPPNFDIASFDEKGLTNLTNQVRAAEQTNNRIKTLTTDAQRVSLDIVELERKLKQKQTERATIDAELATLKEIDVAAIETKVAEYEVMKKHCDNAKKLVDLRAEYSEVRNEAAVLDKIVDTLTTDAPAELMGRVTLPVKGMVITDDGLLFDGKTFDQLCGQERIDVSLSIAKALNGKFGIVCVDGIERLDDESYALFLKQMGTDETQYFVTQVGQRGVGITIEDGLIKKEAA